MARCKNCGRELSDRDTVCGTCFTPVIPGVGSGSDSEKYNVFCIIGFCFSVSIVLAFIFPGLALMLVIGPLFGLPFSIAGTATCTNPERRGRVFGILGIVVSGAELLFMVLILGMFAFSFKPAKRDREMKYKGNVEQIGAFDIRYEGMNESDGNATVLGWHWNGDPEDYLIEIPEDVGKDIHINSVGNPEEDGAGFGESLSIKLDDWERDFKNSDEFHRPKQNVSFIADPYAYGVAEGTKINYEGIVFVIKLGKNIEFCSSCTCDSFYLLKNEDGSLTYIETSVLFEVSPDNPIYYSQDGKLYYKQTDKAA